MGTGREDVPVSIDPIRLQALMGMNHIQIIDIARDKTAQNDAETNLDKARDGAKAPAKSDLITALRWFVSEAYRLRLREEYLIQCVAEEGVRTARARALTKDLTELALKYAMKWGI